MKENWDLTQGVDEIQLLKEKVEALTEIIHNPNFVLVVRCKDCICHPKMGNWGGKYEQKPPYRCPMEHEDEYYSFCPNPDDYCPYGIRRKDNG